MGAWYSYFIKRPKLIVSGGGGGGTVGGIYHNSIMIENVPGYMGIRLSETIIFGKVLFYDKHIGGLIFKRDDAEKCSAMLYDKETGDFIRALWWQLPGSAPNREATLSSGQSASLMLFARLDSEPLKYFVYDLDEAGKQIVPNENLKFDSTREFIVRIRHSHSLQPIVINFKVTKGYERLYFSVVKGYSGSF
jgi:hypothetical protein